MAYSLADPAKPQALPDEVFRNHIGILGKTGSGKTTTAKGFAERLMDEGRRLCVIALPASGEAFACLPTATRPAIPS